MEEEDHIHSTLLPAHTHSCCSCCNGSKAAAIAALSFSLFSRSHSLNPLSKHASFIGNSWQLSPAIARGQ